MAEDEVQGGAAGGGKKKIIIIVGAVVALLAINVGVMLFLVNSSKGEGGETAAHGGGPAPAAAPLMAAPEYVPLDPPFVVNFPDQTLVRFLQVTVEVMTRDPSVVEAIKHHMPEIRNNLVLLFSSQDYEAVSTRAGKEKIRAQALAEVQAVMQEHIGRPGVDQIFFTSFVMQ